MSEKMPIETLMEDIEPWVLKEIEFQYQNNSYEDAGFNQFALSCFCSKWGISFRQLVIFSKATNL